MSENKYYKDNIFKRGWTWFSGLFKQGSKNRFDAVTGAIVFFIILIAMLEYKVFESVYGMTGDIILTASALLVTAFGGVYSEIVLRRNESATDDQNMWADWIFYISLVTSAFVGLGAWVNATGATGVNLGFASFSIPEFSQTAVTIITIVTIVDALILRAYFRADVNQVHKRNIARSQSKKVQAELTLEDNLIDFDVQVKSKAEQVLRIEAHRKDVKDQLQKLYNGRVPDEVMRSAMSNLDVIMKEVKTGQDINGDGQIGLSSPNE